MIQFNMLPDVKLQFVKARRTKYLMSLISVVVSIAMVVVLLLVLITVDVVQKKSLRDENTDIAKYSTQLKNVPNLNEILTVQNQLNTLSGLHQGKPVTSRLFPFIAQVTPALANLSTLNLDFTTNSLVIGGSASSLDVISTYTDTLKATSYSVDGGKTTTKAFSAVVLSSFNRDAQGASFTITLNFDPAIFQSQNNITQLIVPSTSGADQSSVFGTGSGG